MGVFNDLVKMVTSSSIFRAGEAANNAVTGFTENVLGYFVEQRPKDGPKKRIIKSLLGFIQAPKYPSILIGMLGLVAAAAMVAATVLMGGAAIIGGILCATAAMGTVACAGFARPLVDDALKTARLMPSTPAPMIADTGASKLASISDLTDSFKQAVAPVVQEAVAAAIPQRRQRLVR